MPSWVTIGGPCGERIVAPGESSMIAAEERIIAVSPEPPADWQNDIRRRCIECGQWAVSECL